VIERLASYVERGGRLALLPRSGRYALEDGRPDYSLLERLGRPKQTRTPVETWSYGKGHVMRVAEEKEWRSPEGAQTLAKLMEWLRVERPVTATPGIRASVSRGTRGQLYVTLLRQNAEAGGGTYRLRTGLLERGRRYTVVNLFEENPESRQVEAIVLEKEVPVSFAAHELKVLRLAPR